ncbi:MAG: LysR substrate-binding domain-containing protein [Xylophilus ampelinus]
MNLLSSMRYLMALHEHRHFGRAAQACHITQPALSNAVRALEAEFGVAIVRRGRSFAGLTPEGERVLRTARRMVREHEMLQQELDSEAGAPRGALRIGAVPTAIPVAARFAAALQARMPGIAPVVRSMSSPAIEVELEAFSLDLGLGYTDRLGSMRFELRPQYVERYFLLCPAAGDAAPDTAASGPRVGPPVSWKEAASRPLCLMTPEMHSRTIVDSAFALAGAFAKPAMETDSVLTLVLAVHGGGVQSVLPGALVAALGAQPGLQAHPLVSPDVQTPVGFMLQAGSRASPVMDAALALADDPEWLRTARRCSGSDPGDPA